MNLGKVSRPARWIVAFLLLLSLAWKTGDAIRGCSRRPDPVPGASVSPSPSASPVISREATASAGVIGKNTVSLIFRPNNRPSRSDGSKSSITGNKETLAMGSESSATDAQEAGGVTSSGLPDGYFELKVEQEIIATSSAGTKEEHRPEIDMKSAGHGEQCQYSPIGVMVATAPGVVLLDWRAVRLGPVGIDLAINHRAIAGGVSAGDKVFVFGGGSLTFQGTPGIAAGIGARF